MIERASELARGGFVAAEPGQHSGDHPGAAKPVEEDAGYYGRLLLSPGLAYHLAEIGRLVRSAADRLGSYSHAEREFVDQVLSRDLGTNVIQARHIRDAVASGVRHEAVAALHYGRESELTESEQGLAQFIRAVVNGDMTDAYWAETEQRQGERWMVEYSIFILYLQMTMRLQQLVGMPEPSDAEVRQLIVDAHDAGRPLPGPHQPWRLTPRTRVSRSSPSVKAAGFRSLTGRLSTAARFMSGRGLRNSRRT